MKLIRNNVSYEIDEGMVLKLCKNETLDSATVMISNQTTSIGFVPYDLVLIQDEEERFDDRWMLIDSVSVTQICLSPSIYNYTISLFSCTKALENIPLPTLRITNNGLGKTVWDYLNQYLNEYGPRYRASTENSDVERSFPARYVFSEGVQEKFSSILCPEMQWNGPTLREVFNDLMMVADCIPVVNKFTIDYVDLKELSGTEVTGYNYVETSQSSEDYVSELYIDLHNVQEDKDTNRITTTLSESIIVKSDDPLLTTENFFLETQHPIARIRHLFCTVWGYDENSVFGVPYTVDLCDVDGVSVVHEEAEFNTLPVQYSNPGSTPSWSSISQYQNYSLFYTRNSTYIQNLQNKTRYQRIIWNYSNRRTYELYYQLISGNSYPTQAFTAMFFRVVYDTYTSNVNKISKRITAASHDRVIVDNQTNSYVDGYKIGMLEYFKANRLGNVQKLINGRYTSSRGIDLGDTLGSSIVYQVEYRIYKDHVETNAYATAEYVLQLYYTGVKSKIRSWKIVDGSEASEKNDLVKLYVVVGSSPIYEYRFLSQNLSEYFLSPLLYQGMPKPIKWAAAQFKTSNNTVLPGADNADVSYKVYYSLPEYPANIYYHDFTDDDIYVLMDLNVRIIGNSIVFTTGFKDNFYAGTYNGYTESSLRADVSDGTGLYIPATNLTSGGLNQRFLRYVDSNGENVSQTIKLMDDFVDPLYFDKIDLNDSSTTYSQYRVRSWYPIQYRHPKVYQSSFGSGTVGTSSGTRTQNTDEFVQFGTTINHRKDNAEILKTSIQFEFSEYGTVAIHKPFIENQKAIASDLPTRYSYQFTKSSSDFIQHGGEITYDTPRPTNILALIDGTGYGGQYTLTVGSLVGKTLSSLSISGGIPNHPNTVSFNSSTGTFSGSVYSTSSTPSSFHGVITLTVSGEETPYWQTSYSYTFSELAGVSATNLVLTGGGSGSTIHYTKATGTFSGFIKLYTQPSSTNNFTISYTLPGAIIGRRIYISNTWVDRMNDLLPSDALDVTANTTIVGESVTEQYECYSAKIYIDNPYVGTWKYMYITDLNGRIMLSDTYSSYDVIYVSILKLRDRKKYDADGNITGSI